MFPLTRMFSLPVNKRVVYDHRQLLNKNQGLTLEISIYLQGLFSPTRFKTMSDVCYMTLGKFKGNLTNYSSL